MFRSIKDWFVGKLKPWVSAHPKETVLAAGIVGIGTLIWIGGAIVTNGVIAGLLISSAVGVLIWKVGKSKNAVLQRVYKEIVAHPLLSDVGVSGMALMLAPSGITGWISAAVAALIASVWLIAAQPEEKLEAPPVATVIDEVNSALLSGCLAR